MIARRVRDTFVAECHCQPSGSGLDGLFSVRGRYRVRVLSAVLERQARMDVYAVDCGQRDRPKLLLCPAVFGRYFRRVPSCG